MVQADWSDDDSDPGSATLPGSHSRQQQDPENLSKAGIAGTKAKSALQSPSKEQVNSDIETSQPKEARLSAERSPLQPLNSNSASEGRSGGPKGAEVVIGAGKIFIDAIACSAKRYIQLQAYAEKCGKCCRSIAT